MQLARSPASVDPRRFGRGPVRDVSGSAASSSSSALLSAELKLFVTTFLAGFVFVSVLIA